ncbi:MAG: polysaccharide deacetylase family protein [Bacteroidota bacterium]
MTEAILLLLPLPGRLNLFLAGSVLLILLLILARGASRINSQIFVRTLCRSDQTGSQESLDQVALTFDDGPHPDRSRMIMELLERYRCKATFFLTGAKVEGNEKLVREMVDLGHLIGNHSYSHSNLFPLFRSSRIAEEIGRTNRLLEEVTNRPVRYFRPPFGVTNPNISRGLKGLGVEVIGWSIRSMDTRNEPPEKVVGRIMRQIRGGDIILLHETSDHILEILEQLLPAIRQRGLDSVPVDQLLSGR